VPTVRSSRTIHVPADELWEVVSDPHHLPRWWPRVRRVEDVREDAFTEVMISSRGRTVRADFRVVREDASERTLVWEQIVEGTPFERVLRSAETELHLEPVASKASDGAGEDSTRVTIELRQELGSRPSSSFGRVLNLPRLGGVLVRRAADATVEAALDGLELIGGH
jgi:uncharacterized protein YndB with AHSA1/START domain